MKSHHDMGGGPAGRVERDEHAYDEWEQRVDALMVLLAHKDRQLVIGPGSGDGVTRIKDPFVHHIVIDGRLAGSWTRTVERDAVSVVLSTYERPTDVISRSLDAAARRLGRFLNLPATSSWADRR